VLGQYQDFAVGDWAFNMNSLFGKELPLEESNAFRVGGFEINQWLLWEKLDSTWSWLLKPVPGGKTRLIVRIRAHPGNLFWALFMEFGEPRWREGCLRASSPGRRRNPNERARPAGASFRCIPGKPLTVIFSERTAPTVASRRIR
jgi:hypothetical protein